MRGDREVVLVHVVDPERRSADARARRASTRASSTPSASVTGRRSCAPSSSSVRRTRRWSRFAETEGADLIVIAARSTPATLLQLGSRPRAGHRATARPGDRRARSGSRGSRSRSGERPLHVLLGIDDSATCDLGIQWTHALRKRGPVEVVLGAIYYPDDAAAHYGLDAQALVDRDPEVERLMHARSAPPVRRRSARSVTARARRGLGRIGDHIVELARESRSTRSSSAPVRRPGLGRLGSVSSMIVHDAPQSVVCVPPQAPSRRMTVPAARSALVATDLSPFANRAVPVRVRAHREPDGEVHIVHVVKDDAEVDEAELTRQLLRARPAGAKQQVTAHVVRGDDAATTIAQCRRAARRRRRSASRRTGARASRARSSARSPIELLRATRLPVLVLRPTERPLRHPAWGVFATSRGHVSDGIELADGRGVYMVLHEPTLACCADPRVGPDHCGGSRDSRCAR